MGKGVGVREYEVGSGVVGEAIGVEVGMGVSVGVGVGMQERNVSLYSPKDDVVVCHSFPPSVFLLNELLSSGAFAYEYCSISFADDVVGDAELSNSRTTSVDALLKLKSEEKMRHEFGARIV